MPPNKLDFKDFISKHISKSDKIYHQNFRNYNEQRVCFIQKQRKTTSLKIATTITTTSQIIFCQITMLH